MSILKTSTLYLDAAGNFQPLKNLMFCRHTKSLLSEQSCDIHVEGYFCPQNLGGKAKSECLAARGKSNTSYKCPISNNALSLKINFSPNKNSESANTSEEQTTEQARSYYLFCHASGWSSRDAGIPDQTIQNFDVWSKFVNKNPQMDAYFEQMKSHLQKEVQNYLDLEKNRKAAVDSSINTIKIKMKNRKISKNPLANILADRYGSSNNGLEESLFSKNAKIGAANTLLDKIVATGSNSVKRKFDEVPEFPLGEDKFTAKTVDFQKDEDDLNFILSDDQKNQNFSDFTTLDQKLRVPNSQPTYVKELGPIQAPLVLQNSLKYDGHRLMKPDYNAQNIQPKIRNLAIDSFPNIEVLRKYDEESEIVSLSITNPNYRKTNLYLLPFHLREELCFDDDQKDGNDNNTQAPEDLKAKLGPGIITKNNLNLEQIAPASLLPPSQITLWETISSQDENQEDVIVQDQGRVLIHRNRARVNIEVPIQSNLLRKQGYDCFYLPLKVKFDHVSQIVNVGALGKDKRGKSDAAEPTVEWLEARCLIKIDI